MENSAQDDASELSDLKKRLQSSCGQLLRYSLRRNENLLSASLMSGVVRSCPMAKAPRLLSLEIWIRSVQDFLKASKSVKAT